MTDVLIVGAGVSATAAALAAASARADVAVTLLDGGPGASSLATGALDILPWQSRTKEGSQPDHDGSGAKTATASLRAVLDALGGHALPDRGAALVTTAGIARPADGHDEALLNLRLVAGRRVGVVRCDRPGWDADGLAAAWGESFVAVDATVVRYLDERSLPDADFAARHDDADRLGWLAERLRDGLARAGSALGALIVPPALGVERTRAAELTRLVGLPCGEALAAPGGPSGLRFERARDRALATAGVRHKRARVSRIARQGERWRVTLEDGEALAGDAVVLATGGLLAGGIAYAPSEAVLASALPPFARVPFRLGVELEGPFDLGAHGRPLELPGSLFGVPPESLAWPFVGDALMERVGILAGPDGRVGPGLYAAGELVADAPRTWLQALDSGARAGAAAARETAGTAARRPPEATAGGATPPSRP
jgi:glycine/D-amino acid oxidase-like deaminating enzyme